MIHTGYKQNLITKKRLPVFDYLSRYVSAGGLFFVIK